MIVEDNAGRSIGLEHDMVMLAIARAGRRLVINIVAQFLAMAMRIDAHAPGHAQMDHQGLAAVQRRQQIFGAAAQAHDFSPSQPFGKAGRKRDTQIAAPDDGLCDHMAFERRLQAQADGFDFG